MENIGEKKRKEYFIKNWPFVVQDEDYHYNLKYKCVHCDREGHFKNYRLVGGLICCEYQDCDGTAIDMHQIDPIEEEVYKMWQAEGRPGDWTDDDWQKARETVQLQGRG
jgi:endonuclease I